MQSSNLLDLLKSTGAMLEGHFLLTSGRHSNVYIEKFRILENPDSLNKVCKSMSQVVKNNEIDLVLGAAVGGILIAGGVGRYLEKKHIFSERVQSKMELRRGFSIKKGEKIVIVEDIVTTGGSVFELIRLAEKNESEIVHIINLVDRSIKGMDFGYPSSSILHLPSESYMPNNCPLCEKGMPITQRGRTGKKIETV